LESKKCPRRHLVRVIGTNSIATNPKNYRCDAAYLVSNTSAATFKEEMQKIIVAEKPDLILSGRDEDTEAVMRLLMESPDLPGRTPYGNLETLICALDKWETWQFCQRHQLPFAATFVVEKSGGEEELKGFVQEYGYPLIAKPIQGYASKGVFFVRTWDEAQQVLSYPGYMFQEYLGDGATLKKYFDQLDGPTPLFAHAPNIFHHSCHTVIAPDGSFDRFFISRNEHDSGVTVGFKKVEHPELEELACQYARAIARDGGCGPVTIQFRENREGYWKAQEMNMRTNGNTYPRFLMGQDDIGLIVEALGLDANFPVYRPPATTHRWIVGKTLSSYVMEPEMIDVLKQRKVWCRAEE
jgi:hypothetical protein